MSKSKIIPNEYMTIGEIANKMGVTVRTLQYYHKKGLLSPSAKSDGGRRLYTNKDLIKLYQILSLKGIGFSLDDIKNKIMALDSPLDVANALTIQAADIKRKIQNLSKAYEEINLLKSEVLQMQYVDFKKYADILTNIQMKNEFYWLIKHFDEPVIEHIENRFDSESSLEFMNRFKLLSDNILSLEKENILPSSEAAQLLAKSFWELVMEFANGDMNVLSSLMKLSNIHGSGSFWEEKQGIVNSYIEKALDIYFAKLGVDPLT